MARRAYLSRLIVLLLILAALSSCNDSNPDEGLEQQLAAVTAERDSANDQLVAITAERDAFEVELASLAGRYDKTMEVKTAIRAILDSPADFGSEDEVTDLLATYATPTAQMADDVFGAIGMREAWYRTLYGDQMDATIKVWHQWVAADGSQSGSIWVWEGLNQAGNEFELIGVALDTHDVDGLVEHELVIYPYSHAYVWGAVVGAGT